MKGDQQLTEGLIKSGLGEYKGSLWSCPRVIYVSFSCDPRVLLVLEPRGRLGGVGVIVVSAFDEFADNDGGVLA